jgi:hypothetical protein
LTPILGTIASSTQQGLSTNSFESISTVTLTSTSNSISFSSIPATYTHLQIRSRTGYSSSPSTNVGDFYLRFNGDTGNNYASHYMVSGGSGVGVGGTANTSVIGIGYSESTSSPHVFICDILNYRQAVNKNVRSLGGYSQNGNGYISIRTGQWRNTSAITSITITPQVNSFGVGSSFALYGIKGVS